MAQAGLALVVQPAARYFQQLAHLHYVDPIEALQNWVCVMPSLNRLSREWISWLLLDLGGEQQAAFQTPWRSA